MRPALCRHYTPVNSGSLKCRGQLHQDRWQCKNSFDDGRVSGPTPIAPPTYPLASVLGLRRKERGRELTSGYEGGHPGRRD